MRNFDGKKKKKKKKNCMKEREKEGLGFLKFSRTITGTNFPSQILRRIKNSSYLRSRKWERENQGV